jgi:hypothetical protein
LAFVSPITHLLAADRRREVREERSELTRSPTMETENYLQLIGEEKSKKNIKVLDLWRRNRDDQQQLLRENNC